MSHLDRIERKMLWYHVINLQREYESVNNEINLLQKRKAEILSIVKNNLAKAQKIADKELIEEYEYLKANNL